MATETEKSTPKNYTPKVCPVILRTQGEQTQILAFQHPLAGSQIIKGTLESGERPEEGLLRELAEESGIDHAVVGHKLGERSFDDIEQHWHIFLCQPTQPPPERWSHFTTDGGGHTFRFFWHNLNREPDDSWHPIFKTALAFIQSSLSKKTQE